MVPEDHGEMCSQGVRRSSRPRMPSMKQRAQDVVNKQRALDRAVLAELREAEAAAGAGVGGTAAGAGVGRATAGAGVGVATAGVGATVWKYLVRTCLRPGRRDMIFR